MEPNKMDNMQRSCDENYMNTHLIIILKVKFQKAIIIHAQIVHNHFSSMTTNILKLNAYEHYQYTHKLKNQLLISRDITDRLAYWIASEK